MTLTNTIYHPYAPTVADGRYNYTLASTQKTEYKKMENRLNSIEQKLSQIESKQIQQNRNIVSIVKNVVDYGFDDKDLEKRKAAWVSFGGYLLRQRVLIFFTSILTLLLSGFSIYIAYNANKLIGEQNKLIKDEFKLIEAERHSSLIFLMSNVMDKLYEDVKGQHEIFEKDGIPEQDMRFNVSTSLRARIIALSSALKPYHILKNGTPSKNKTSPERGQLLNSLLHNQLNHSSSVTIFSSGDFSYANLSGMYLWNKILNAANLQHASLKDINIYSSDFHETQLNGATLEEVEISNTDLTGCNLSNASLDVNFIECNLGGANFSNSDLKNSSFYKTCLCGANFEGAKNLKAEQFIGVNSLYGE